jgi:phospholipase C
MSNSDAIDHVILVILENRSFDHVLGWMSHPKYGNNSAVDGLVGDVDAATGELTATQYRNPAHMQTYRPFFVETDEPLAADLPHSREEVAMQMAYSQVTGTHTMRGFAAAYFQHNPMQAGPNAPTPDCLRMMTPPAIPVTAFLANNFRVCDRWFTAIPTDTHPNRMMALSGYSEIDGTKGLEPDQRILFDWADENKLDWRVYSEDFSFMMCMKSEEGFRGLGVLAERAKHGRYRSFASFAHEYQYDETFPQVTMIEPSYLDDPFTSEPNDNHPPLPMGPGESFLLKIYSAFFGTELSRKRFEKTMLVVYYDEHGGFFDHVAPPKVLTPSGRLNSTTTYPSFTHLGPRIPGIVVSPLVDTGVFKGNLDHTSVLRFLAERFTPGKEFSPEVTSRHKPSSANLRSLGDVLDRAAAREAPYPPNVGALRAVSYPTGRTAMTAGQQAFLEARQALHRDAHDDMTKAHPDGFFSKPHH